MGSIFLPIMGLLAIPQARPKGSIKDRGIRILLIFNLEIHDILKRNSEIWDLFTRKEQYNNLLRDRYDMCGWIRKMNGRLSNC